MSFRLFSLLVRSRCDNGIGFENETAPLKKKKNMNTYRQNKLSFRSEVFKCNVIKSIRIRSKLGRVYLLLAFVCNEVETFYSCFRLH